MHNLFGANDMPDKLIGKRRRLIVRVALAAGASCLALVGILYVRTVPVPQRVKWLRENRLGWAADLAERAWPSLKESSAPEPRPGELSPFPEPFARRRAAFRRPLEPPPIAVVFPKPLPDEGVWQGVGSTINGVPALRCAFFRPDADRPDVAVGVARFTAELTRFVLVPGAQDPGGDWRWHGGVPEDQRESLLAAFNAGFLLRQAKGGFYAEGKVAKPLVDGVASFVIDRNGAPDIIAWTADKLTPDVEAVRQNLELIVADGEVLSRGTPQSAPRKGMWRSGLGITRDGTLIYLVGHDLSLFWLAAALKHVGALRAMQLDVHSGCQSFDIFQPGRRGGPKLVATRLLTTMRQPANRYLEPDGRDFISAFLR